MHCAKQLNWKKGFVMVFRSSCLNINYVFKFLTFITTVITVCFNTNTSASISMCASSIIATNKQQQCQQQTATAAATANIKQNSVSK